MTITIPDTKIPTLTATGRDVDGAEFGVEVAPEYTGETYGYDEIAQLPDGRYAYAIDDHAAGWTGLYLEAIAMDSGDNVVRRRSAAKRESLEGLTKRTFSSDLTKVGEKLVGWLK